MKMKNIYHHILIVSLLVFAFSTCTERMDDVELKSKDPVLVVFGGITTDTMAHSIRLTISDNYFANKPATPVTGANVEIVVMDKDSTIEDIISLEESDEKNGNYYTAPGIYGEINKSYHLSITGVDIDDDGITEEYSATSGIDSVGKIDSIKLKYINTFIEGWELKVYAWDPPEKNYYLFKVRINNTLVTDTLNEWFIQDDAPFNGNYTNGIASQYLQFRKKDERTEKGDTVTFELGNISLEYYNFIMHVQTETSPQIPIFSGPPANISTNLTNGAFGFFYAYAVAKCSTVAPEIPVDSDE